MWEKVEYLSAHLHSGCWSGGWNPPLDGVTGPRDPPRPRASSLGPSRSAFDNPAAGQSTHTDLRAHQPSSPTKRAPKFLLGIKLVKG